jgi:hypothetical protein
LSATPNPVLTIVSGSVRRVSALKRMLESARKAMPFGVPYEFIIATIAEDAETRAFLATQPDCRVIVQNGLKGGIQAFDAGFATAQGRYVCAGNDDIIFMPHSLALALRHLDSNPTCGAVAFADNRPAPHKVSDGAGYGVQLMQTLSGGRLYAQVGLFRKWLGDLCGWWGSQDPVMQHAHTYGGDNYLSARIWELGYTVETITGARVQDDIPMDALREANYRVEQTNPGVYYKRYPKGPHIRSMPLLPPPPNEPHTRKFRTLYLPIYEPGWAIQKEQKRGLRDALARIGYVWEVDYINERVDLETLVKVWKPDLLLTQMHSATYIDANALKLARAAWPNMRVVNWDGDVYAHKLEDTALNAYLRECDVQTVVNASVLDDYAEMGIPAAYWQVSYEPVDVSPVGNMVHDVCFLANAYSDERKALGALLESVKGVNVGLYGSGWTHGRANTTYDFKAGRAILLASKVAIGDNQYTNARGFVSNRFFETLAAGGAMLLHQHVDGLEELLGLKSGVHYISWADSAELPGLIEYWTAKRNDRTRRKIAAAGMKAVHERHSFDARVRELLTDILPKAERVKA